MNLTISQTLDRDNPAYCGACSTPYKRSDALWVSGSMRNLCPRCGLDQTSEEAGAIARCKGKA